MTFFLWISAIFYNILMKVMKVKRVVALLHDG